MAADADGFVQLIRMVQATPPPSWPTTTLSTQEDTDDVASTVRNVLQESDMRDQVEISYSMPCGLILCTAQVNEWRNGNGDMPSQAN